MDLKTYKLVDSGSYDDVTDSFEYFTERFTSPIAKRLVEIAGISAGTQVLDVGCGTGVVTRLAAQRVGPAGRVFGIDLSEGMLLKARELLIADGTENRTALTRGDAEALEFDDASVDTILSLYALRHFPDPLRALREMQRVARPGSTVAVAVGSAAPIASLDFARAVFRRVHERVLAFVGRGPLLATAFLDGLLDEFLPAPPSDHLAAWEQSHEHSHESVPEMMRQTGFHDIRSTWVGQTSTIASIEEFWLLQVTLSSGARKRMAVASSDERSRLRSRFDSLCTLHLARGGSLQYRSGALIVTGTVPSAR